MKRKFLASPPSTPSKRFRRGVSTFVRGARLGSSAFRAIKKGSFVIKRKARRFTRSPNKQRNGSGSKVTSSSSAYTGSDTRMQWKMGKPNSLGRFKLIKDCPPIKWVVTGSGLAQSLPSSTGYTQGYVDLPYMGPTELSNFGSLIQNNIWQNVSGSFSSNPNQSAGAQKFFWKYTSIDIQLYNSSVTAMELELYDYIPKRDNVTTLAGYLTTMNSNDPTTAGRNTALTPASVYPTIANYGVKPQDDNYATLHYNIKKAKKVKLAPGETHHHKIFLKYNKLYDPDLIDLSHQNYKGWSAGVFIIWKGAPVTYSGNTSQTQPANQNLRWIATARYCGKGVAIGHKHLEYSSTIANPTGDVIWVNEAQGVIMEQSLAVSTNNLLNTIAA